MKPWSLFLAGCILLAGPALGQDIRTVDGVQYFVQEWKASTSAGNLIQLEDIGGGIDIGPSNDGQLRLELRVPVGGRSRPEALAYGREFAPLLKPGPDGVHVEGRGAPMGARYLIQIPRDTRVALDTDGGSINIHDVRASFRIDHAGGTVQIRGVSGSIDLETAGGDVEVLQIGDRVEIHSDGGDVAVEGVAGDLRLVTGGGRIEVNGVRGSVNITTAGGNIELSDVGRDAVAVTSAGRIEVGNVGGNAELTTGGGDIEASDIRGSLTASSSGGDVEADAIGGRIRVEALAGDVELSAVSAPVRVISQVGDVEIEVTDASFLASGMLEVDLGHGNISLLLPRRTNALLQANIQEEGTIDIVRTGWKVEVLRTRGGAARQAELRIGEGGGTLRVTLRSGEIAVDHS